MNLTDYSLPVALATALIDHLVSIESENEAAPPTRRRRREILATALELLDQVGDPETYILQAQRVHPSLLSPILERRLEDNDGVLPGLASRADLLDHDSLPFFRTLAISLYRTDIFGQAVELADNIHAVTGRPDDLVNLALILKGTDTEISNEFTMSRCRQMVKELLAAQATIGFTEQQTAFLFYSIGRIYGDTLEHQHESRKFLQRSLDGFERLGAGVPVLALKNAIALSHFDVGNFKTAYVSLRGLVDMISADPDSVPRMARHAALINLHILSFLANEDVAELIRIDEIANWEIRAYYLNNLFLVEALRGHHETAETLAVECRNLTRDRRGVYSRAAILNNMGVLNGNREDVEISYDICRGSGYSLGEAITGRNLGLDYPSVGGVLSVDRGLLWPCLKNIDVLGSW